MLQIFKETKFPFVEKRKLGYIFSSTLILISIISLIIHGGPKYNIDFTGGILIHLKFQRDVSIQELRDLLTSHGLKDAEIKNFGAGNEVSIRTGLDKSLTDVTHIISDDLKASMKDNPFELLSLENVGPKIGHELIIEALLAIFWSMVLILFYVMFRFELRFSLGAIAALMHDVTITIGVFSVFNIEISAPIIAAVLTIVGYSLNDTIVVYDRIRENIKAAGKNLKDLSGVINTSINETLSRTIMTSGTTLIVVVVLYLFGGEVLRTFALALFIGILIGTYSSIFVASPVVLEWKTKKA